MALAIRRLVGGDASIGDVKDSVLSEAQFLAMNGPGWCLADGRSIIGSKLHQIFGFTTATDIRGLFRRALNNGRSDVYADPGGGDPWVACRGMRFRRIRMCRMRTNIAFWERPASCRTHLPVLLCRTCRDQRLLHR